MSDKYQNANFSKNCFSSSFSKIVMTFSLLVLTLLVDPARAAPIIYDEPVWVHQLGASWTLNDLPTGSPTEFDCNTTHHTPDTGQCEFVLSTNNQLMAHAGTFASFPSSSTYFDGATHQTGTSGSLGALSSINVEDLSPDESIEIFTLSEFTGIIRNNTFDTWHIVGDAGTSFFEFSIRDLTLNTQVFEATTGDIHWRLEEVFTLPVLRGHDYRVYAKVCTRTYEQSGPFFDNCAEDIGLGDADASVAWTLAGQVAIPIPPAIWLFGSGFIGLIGIARRKKA